MSERSLDRLELLARLRGLPEIDGTGEAEDRTLEVVAAALAANGLDLRPRVEVVTLEEIRARPHVIELELSCQTCGSSVTLSGREPSLVLEVARAFVRNHSPQEPDQQETP